MIPQCTWWLFLIWDLWSVPLIFIFLSREREQELYGPKKRGPKPKTLLLKVGKCILFVLQSDSFYLLWKYTPFTFFILLLSHEHRLLRAHPESLSLNLVGPSRPPNLRLRLHLHPRTIPVALRMLSCSPVRPSPNWRKTSTDVIGWHDGLCPVLTL